jgi:hypothetical protein
MDGVEYVGTRHGAATSLYGSIAALAETGTMVGEDSEALGLSRGPDGVKAVGALCMLAQVAGIVMGKVLFIDVRNDGGLQELINNGNGIIVNNQIYPLHRPDIGAGMVAIFSICLANTFLSLVSVNGVGSLFVGWFGFNLADL